MKRALAIVLLAAAASLGISAPAAATYEPLGSGATTLTLDRSFAAFLAGNGIKLTPKVGARLRGRAVALQVTGGNFDPTLGKGEILQGGSLFLESGRRKVGLRRIVVKTKRSPLVAKVGGSQFKVVTAARISANRNGFGSTFVARRLELTAKVATRLTKKLRPRKAFYEGQAVGSLVSRPTPSRMAVVPSGTAGLQLDPGFLAKLESRFVSLNPIFPAERSGATFSFPIAKGGSVSPDGRAGTLRTGGTIELLQIGGGQIFWQEPWAALDLQAVTAEANIQPTPAFPGKIGRVSVFGVGAFSPVPDSRSRSVAVAGMPLVLLPETASLLNDAFAEGKPVFAAGDPVGALSYVARGQ